MQRKEIFSPGLFIDPRAIGFPLVADIKIKLRNITEKEKNGIKNYIGGNCLMEMGQAYVNNKKIFLLNGLPGQVSYLAEIKAMQPILLHGKLAEII